MRVYQEERLASESIAETEARLQDDRERYRELCRVQPQLSLSEQHLVHHKVAAFYRHLATLDISQCTTCSEDFPGLQLQSQSAECRRCNHNKHIPKLYSTANNMNPRVVPPQLPVCVQLFYSQACLLYSFLLEYNFHYPKWRRCLS